MAQAGEPGLMSMHQAPPPSPPHAAADAEKGSQSRKRAREEGPNPVPEEDVEASSSSATVPAPHVSRPVEGRLHLLPFLLPTHVCDADHPDVARLSRELIPPGTSTVQGARNVRAWIRENINYTLDDKKAKASETFAKREGMCTNKANLQIALLRAAGIAAGYKLVHITKECFRSPHMLPELFEKIHEPTVHCFAAVYLPDVDADGAPLVSGRFHDMDATERARQDDEPRFLEEDASTGETRYQKRWLRGPIGDVQANLDHLLLLKPSARWHLAKNLFDRQNEILRKHPEVV